MNRLVYCAVVLCLLPRVVHSESKDHSAQFVSQILKTSEDVWISLFSQVGRHYSTPQIVLYEDKVRSACGMKTSAEGPNYCRKDQRIYIDLDYFEQVERLGANGNAAVAYFVVHEVGHHVQNLLGTYLSVEQRQAIITETEANQLSVRLELQADCYAGVWAHHVQKEKQFLEPDDIKNMMNAAGIMGEDAQARREGEKINPDLFTQGTSKQRQRWLFKGTESGDPDLCDTFN